MKIKGFVIAQAVKKKFEGIKSTFQKECLFFLTKEDAQNYLFNVLELIKIEMRSGIRADNTLNADEWLDFCITEAELDIPEDKMLKRGWHQS